MSGHTPEYLENLKDLLSTTNPGEGWKGISTQVPPISELVNKAVNRVLTKIDDCESKQLINTLSAVRRDHSKENPLVIALLGKAEVGKSFVCSQLASLDLSDEDKKKLEDMKLHGCNTLKSFTTVPTEIEYGPEVADVSTDRSKLIRITVPSQLLGLFNVRLVDVSFFF